MDLGDFLEKIGRIEDRKDIHSFTYSDFNIWPYVRLKLLQGSAKVANKNGFLLNRFLFLFAILKYPFLYYRNPIIPKHAEVVFFTRSSENQDMVEGKRFNRYSDSFIERYSNNYSVQVIESSDVTQNNTGPSWNADVIYIDWLIFLRKLLFVIKGIFRKEKKYENLNQIIAEEFHCLPNYSKGVDLIQNLSVLFETVLKNYEPKYVFLVCFYRPEAMAISLACKRLGIVSVELQHGAQNDVHPMYSNWKNLPKNGYALLPNIFWMWGDSFTDRISVWAKQTTTHKAVVGGNLWLARPKPSESTSDMFSASGRVENTRVLVTLQGDEIIPGFFWDFLELNTDKFEWYFRDHPRIPVSTETRKNLDRISRVSMRSTSEECLYFLLKNIDLHITGYSTVAFEAQAFGVPTIFMHVNAKHGFSNLLGRSGLYYAESLSDFSEKVDDAMQSSFASEKNYIEAPSLDASLELVLGGFKST